MATELAVRQDAPHPLALVQQAIDKGTDPQVIASMVQLAERWQVNEDKRAFREAMAKFKDNPPKILKDKLVKFGGTEFVHATLDNVCECIVKALAGFGITHRWVPSQKDGQITVTCVLSLGSYSEGTPLSAGADTSGSKNAIQAIGSTVSYLQRYTLLSATGMATEMPDDDGASSELSAGVLAAKAKIDVAGTVVDLQTEFSAAYKAAKGDVAGQKALIAAKDARKAHLQGKAA
jgi:ERF superfamily protein